MHLQTYDFKETKMDVEMKTLAGIEAYGGNGTYHAKFILNSPKYDVLPDEVKNELSYIASKYIDKIRHDIEIEWAKIYEKDKRSDHVTKMESLFTDAGIDPIAISVIDNQYSGDACYYSYPWLRVVTPFGLIAVGWRKRVICIDWSESYIKADGEKLFKEEKVTKGQAYVHAWSYKDAVRYLMMLKDNVK